ncbi:MAG: hypothetical protein NVSMB19_08800 [Vulcanimicrobiaceae bacterium]
MTIEERFIDARFERTAALSPGQRRPGGNAPNSSRATRLEEAIVSHDDPPAALAPFARFDHVQLAMPAGEEARARAFYVDVLALEEVPKPPELAQRGGAWFRSGEVALHLGVDPHFRAATKAHPAIRCTDYARLLERLRAHGVAVAFDDGLFEGHAHCYVADPFGNRLEFIAS